MRERSTRDDTAARRALHETLLQQERLDDLIEVHTRCVSLSGARMTADQKVHLGGTLLVHGTVEACIITLSGKPRRIPQEMRDKLLPFLFETGV